MKHWKSIYWIVIFFLLLIPITNSFFINSKELIRSYNINAARRTMFVELKKQNKSLYNQLRYLKTRNGQRLLVKDKLNKAEEDEVLIKFK